jgi:hypothetical protein
MTLPVSIPNQFSNEVTPLALSKLDQNFDALAVAVNQINESSSNVGFSPAGVGTVNRTVEEKLREFVSVKDFGAVGNGTANDTAAITAAYAAAKEIYFPAGLYLVSSNLTIPAGKVVTLNASAAFTVASGVTLKIYAQVNGNPDSYHFQGSGSVRGVAEVYPEWFGAVGNGTTDDIAAFQKTAACVKDDGSVSAKTTIRLRDKFYLLGNTWTVEPTANRSIDIIGTGTLIGGSRLLSATTGNYTLLNIQGNVDPIQKIVDFTLKGFSLISQNIGKGNGLYFNLIGNAELSGLQQSLVEDIHISNFNFGVSVRNTRLVKFSRMSVWNQGIDGTTFANVNYCLNIVDGSPGTAIFCGDLSFDNCQFVARKDFYSFLVQILAASASSANISLAGIRFTECIFYKGGNPSKSLSIRANNYSQIADIWIDRCQFDDTSGMTVEILSANALVANINITGNYFTAVNGKCVDIVSSLAVGSVNAINVADNYSAGVFNAPAVAATGAHGLTVNNNRWSGVDWAPGAAMLFNNCSQVNVTNNNTGRAGTILFGNFLNLVSLQGTGNYYVVTGNNSAGRATGALINNATGAANTAIANNI